MKKYFIAIVSFILLLGLVACGNGNDEADGDKVKAPDKFLKIGSGPMGSGWYPITTVMSEVYMDKFTGLNASQVEGGSTANLKSLDVGDIQIGINYTSDFVDALKGETEFDKPLDTVAALASLYPVYQQLAVLDNNKSITKVEDIVDKHIFLGPQGGGGPVGFWRMMAEYDITEETIKKAGGKISYGNYSDGMSMMKDGVVDAVLAGGSPMVPAFEEIDVTNPIRILPFDEDKLESLVEKGYGITAGALPANTYKNQTEEVPTYVMITMATMRSDLPEDYAYHLTKFLWEAYDEFERQVPTRAADMTLDTALEGLEKEYLHPGALKYYEEVGVIE